MIVGNLKKTSVLQKATKNVDTVFHFAATADLKEADENPFNSIDIFSDTICPWCYIGKKKLDLAIDSVKNTDNERVLH